MVIMTKLNKISTPINTEKALCLLIAPYKPMQKSTAPSTRKWLSVSPMPLLLPANHYRAHNPYQQAQRSNFECQHVAIIRWTIEQLGDTTHIVDGFWHLGLVH